MNQYCFQISADSEVKPDDIKQHVKNLYYKKKFKELAFSEEDKLPLIVIFSKKDSQVCVKLTSKAKKNVDRIEGIHSKLSDADLKISETIKLSKPSLFKLEQCEWWDTNCLDKDEETKWNTLIHNGPYFIHIMEPYEPHGTPIVYDGIDYILNPEEERVANFYARRIISEEAGNVIAKLTEDSVFNKNFWTDFKKYLSPAHKKIFKDFSKLNFGKIVNKLLALKENTKQVSDIEKTAKKVQTAERKQDYGYAIINGIKEPVANFTIEPAAIFYGRGDNPKRGKIKRDIDPEEVTINVQEGVTVKPPSGHRWKDVIHDHNAAWIASWKDPISKENKYVYLGAEGQLKGKSDYVKYEKARKLNKFLDKVRTKYEKDITGNVKKLKQLGTVLYFIDNYGLRVGNEKDESETDTVGASTLRVEHVKLQEPDIVIFDFLGKDSIRYYKELKVIPKVFANIESFIKGKKPDDALFDLVSATDINNYLKTFDKDFSAKVFRTRLASTIMTNALNELDIKKNATIDEKKKLFTKANIKVADILNHQRTVSTKAKDVIEKYKGELADLKKLLKETKAAGKSTKSIETRIQKKMDQIENKNDTLSVAITTSLTNYIDPRIVVSWLKDNGVPTPKVYTATLQRKFKWALDITEPEWSYTDTELLPIMAILKPIDQSGSKSVTKPQVAKAVNKTVVKSVDKPIVKQTVKPQVVKSVNKTVVKQPAKPQVVKPNPIIESIVYLVYNPNNHKNISIYTDEKFITENIGNNVILKIPVNTFFDGINDSIVYIDDSYLLKNKTKFTKNNSAKVYVVYDKDIDNITGIYTSLELANAELFSDNSIVIEMFTNNTLSKPTIIDYTDKSFAVIGDTKSIKDELKQFGGIYNTNLTINGNKTSGWIFSKKHLEKITDFLNLKDSSIDDISFEMLNENDRNIIKCFAKDTAIVDFLKQDLLSAENDHPVYTDKFLNKFIKCVSNGASGNKSNLIKQIVDILKPSAMSTYLFLAYLLHNIPIDIREKYLKSLLERVGDKEAVQQCLK